MHLFKFEYSFAWLSFLLAESFFWRQNLVLSLWHWIFSKQIMVRSFLCEGFLNLHNLSFPLQKKTPLEVVCLAEWSSFKTSSETGQLLSLGSGMEDSEGLPQGCAHVCGHCAKANLRVPVFAPTTVTSSSFLLKITPGGSASPAVLPARLYIGISCWKLRIHSGFEMWRVLSCFSGFFFYYLEKQNSCGNCKFLNLFDSYMKLTVWNLNFCAPQFYPRSLVRLGFGQECFHIGPEWVAQCWSQSHKSAAGLCGGTSTDRKSVV